MEMGEPVDDGAAAASSSSSSPSSSLSGAKEDAFQDQDQLRGHGARASPAAGVGQTIPRRLWAAARAGAPRLRQACENAAAELVVWTRRGGAPRALLVVSVGSVALAALTGLLVVVFFVAAAATNAAGVFLAVLLDLLAAAYVCALSVAVFVISATTIGTVIAITIATGWATFFWVVWFAARECLNLTTKRWATGATIP